MVTVQRAIQRALTAIRLAFRSRLTSLDSASNVQLAQLDALSGEQVQASELFQQFGFTSAPPTDTQCIVLPLGGKTAHSVIVATEHGSYRIKALTSGEVCIYNQWGASVTLKKEKIVQVDCDHFLVNATESVTMNTKTCTTNASESIAMDTKTWQALASTSTGFTSPTLAFGGVDGAAATASIDADLSTTGSITSDGDHVAGGISLMNHTHSGDSGGTTGTPR